MKVKELLVGMRNHSVMGFETKETGGKYYSGFDVLQFHVSLSIHKNIKIQTE